MRGRSAMLFAFVAASLSAQPIIAGFERFFSQSATGSESIDGGLLLLNELNCVACHVAPPAWRGRVPGREKISLLGVTDRIDAAALRALVRDPQRFKPGTIMPSLLAGDEAGADAIETYLGTLKANAAVKSFPIGDAAHGRQLYESIGCTACHGPTDGKPTFASVPIALAPHYAPDALALFLQNPLHTRPAGRMPAFELTDSEATDLARYLQEGVVVNIDRSRKPPAVGSAARGVFEAKNCVACHEDGSGARAKPAIPLDRARVSEGCLASRPPAGVPDFSLTTIQVSALAAAIRAMQASAAPPAINAEQQIAFRFHQLNCYACHEWRGRGGPDATRARHFVAADSGAESLGDLGHLPPKLDSAGRKLRPMWIEKLLSGSGGGVRPYMTARMPRFGPAAAADLVPLLAEACRPETPEQIDTSGTRGHQRFATGRALIGTEQGGIGCVSCHGLGDRNPTGIRSINLSHTEQRVQPEYFKALLLDPQRIQPGTIMPPLFGGRKAADKEIESLWTYLREFDHNPRLPEGLGAGSVAELKPEREGKPIVFRTFLEGAGTHAIAVGYPARAHVAFDAFEVRWALVWRGRFLDATSNWEERTMPPIKPLGEAERMLPAWMPFARLSNSSASWPMDCGTSAGYIFKGYRLGPDGVPVFRYRVGELEVEDVLEPSVPGSGLHRKVTVRGHGDGWFFRGLAGNATPQRLVWQNGVAHFEETIEF